MAAKFYAGQKDYVVKLNEMDKAFQDAMVVETSYVAARSTLSTNEVDFNTIAVAGVYVVTGDGTWLGSTNGPTNAAAHGQLVVTLNGNVTVQEYYPHINSTASFRRIKFNVDDWTGWVEQWNVNNLWAVSQLTNDADYASRTYVDSAVSALVDVAPEALNTLNELAAALGDDANFAATMTNALSLKADKTEVATSLALKANLASPVFTGSLRVPVWTTASRPANNSGEIGFNTDIGKFEGFNGTEWGAIGGQVTVKDEGTDVSADVKTFNFTGAGVTVTQGETANDVKVHINGTERDPIILPVVVGQLSYVVPGGYTPGSLDVRVNGLALPQADYTANDGVNLVLGEACSSTTDVLEVVRLSTLPIIPTSKMTTTAVQVATEGQTAFPVNYSIGTVIPVVNGNTVPENDYIANNGTSVVFAKGLPQGTEVFFIVCTAMNLTNALPNTGGSLSGDLSVPSLNGGPLAGMRNRIINGDMRIDQRNNGSSVACPASATTYTVDRFAWLGVGCAVTAQRVSDAPVGFVNSLKVTVSTANATMGTDDFSLIQHPIEGSNLADLAWGTTSASSVVLSFRVKSNVTGNFIATLRGDGRSYAIPYVINAAGTWEAKAVVIPGDIVGAWATDNTTGVTLFFSMGTGATQQLASTGSWLAASGTSHSSQVNVMAAVGNYLQITGVQLEAGNRATPFERRPYGLELSLCQRYFEPIPAMHVTTYLDKMYDAGKVNYQFKVPKRVGASLTLYLNGLYRTDGTAYGTQITEVDAYGFRLRNTVAPGGTPTDYYVGGYNSAASAEL